jgi:hypothetical protein
MQFVLFFGSVLFLKIFVWLAQERVNYVRRLCTVSYFALLLLLCCVDWMRT